MANQQSTKQVLRGIAASSGIVMGRAYLVHRGRVNILHKTIELPQIAVEIKRFKRAIEKSKHQLQEIKEKILAEEVRRHFFILDVYLMILEDKMLIQDTIEVIKTRMINAEWALDIVIGKLNDAFDTIEDEYLRERKNDVNYVAQRIFRNLVGRGYDDLARIKGNVIVVAQDLSPADTIQMNFNQVAGFVTDIGGRISHTAILSRSLGIPAVVGLETATSLINGGDLLIIDGYGGTVIINPDKETSEEYIKRRKRIRLLEREVLKYAALPAETRDGYRIRVGANIELAEELPLAISHGAEGIGLFRTEILYLNREDLPSEEEQFHTYRKIVEGIAPRSVVIRSLDVGGDKFLSKYGYDHEVNPALGLRAIRFSLKERNLFKIQLRGMLRASAFGKLKILFPMISGIAEIRKAKSILEEVKEELKAEGVAFDEGIEVGAMIEIPSASIIADALANEVDFFSIGTNDLIQYALAIDRINEHVSYLYEPLHPAILRMIRGIVEAGHQAGIEVAICGEMAADPVYILILLGLGLDALSMNPFHIPRVKKILRSSSYEESKQLLEEVFRLSTAREIEDSVKAKMAQRFPDDFTMGYHWDQKG
ncbi:MAG: phosphoenolpyruvate--protein phosphotransferase [Syntrophobacterales bacterium]|nr:MAG: phosphoenolpyruvate--protein phosphotransferase [Syntrophobacterales bacterium]